MSAHSSTSSLVADFQHNVQQVYRAGVRRLSSSSEHLHIPGSSASFTGGYTSRNDINLHKKKVEPMRHFQNSSTPNLAIESVVRDATVSKASVESLRSRDEKINVREAASTLKQQDTEHLLASSRDDLARKRAEAEFAVLGAAFWGPRESDTQPNTLGISEEEYIARNVVQTTGQRKSVSDGDAVGARPLSSHGSSILQLEKKQRKDIPKITIDDVERWIVAKKEHTKPKLAGQHFLDDLNNRNQRTFAALAYLVKQRDPDGIEMRFCGSPAFVHRSRNRKALLSQLNKVTFSKQSHILPALQMILEETQAQEKKHRVLSFRPKKKLGTNIYILTNGIGDEGEDWPNPVASMLKGLERSGLERGRVGIQFIKFGRGEEASRQLVSLDSKLPSDGLNQSVSLLTTQLYTN
ncbi:hypothetical protein PSPO01_02418 [Paraphaeosphaeria sporulosa]